MSYTGKTWNSGDIITAVALNNMENGIRSAHNAIAAGGGSSSSSSASGGAAPVIYCWGDSLTEGVGGSVRHAENIYDDPAYSYPAVLSQSYDVVNCGARGEDIHAIMARQGADPIVVGGFTIPADRTPVKIGELNINAGTGLTTRDGNTAMILRESEGAGFNPVVIAGVEGIVYRVLQSGYDHTSTYAYNFVRSVAGSAVTVAANTEVETHAMRNFRNGVAVIWMGANGGYTSHNDFVSKVQAMVAYGQYSDYVVILSREFADEWAQAIKTLLTGADDVCHVIYLREELPERGYMLAGLCYQGIDTSGWTTTDVIKKQCPLLCEYLSGQSGEGQYGALHYSAWGYKAIGRLVREKLDAMGVRAQGSGISGGSGSSGGTSSVYEANVEDSYGTVLWRLREPLSTPRAGYVDTGFKPFDTAKNWTIACAFSDDFAPVSGSIGCVFECRKYFDGATNPQVAAFLRIVDGSGRDYGFAGGVGAFNFPQDQITSPSEDGWHYAVIAKDGDNYSFYLDGRRAWDCPLGYGVPSDQLFSDTMLLFARKEGSYIGEYGAGTIKQFRIYDSFMSDTACKAILADMQADVRE